MFKIAIFDVIVKANTTQPYVDVRLVHHKYLFLETVQNFSLLGMVNKALTFTGKVVLAVAILIGLVGKFSPHLFFKIPNGFIPWVIMGNPLPPYITTEPWLPENRGWTRPNDVVVSVAPKSGTTWMLFCSHQIRVKGDDETYPYVDVSISTPWPDMVQTPGDKVTMSWESRRKALNTTVLPDGTPLSQYWDNPDYPFRIFKSHHLPEIFGDLIGGDSKLKLLAMARNGLDQVASAAPFFNNHNDDFRKLWGGFPPASSGDTREDALTRMDEMLPGGIFHDWYFKYVNEWWKVKDEKNVLLLHYSDAKKDLSGNYYIPQTFMCNNYVWNY